MKIIAIGMNYAAHVEEMENVLPQQPVFFLKPDSAILKDDKPFFYPDFSKQVEYETELVVRICRLGKHISPKFAHRYYDAVTVGVDFTARDLQNQCRQQGLPWEVSKSFDNSAVLGKFVALEGMQKDLQNLHFSLNIDGQRVQEGYSKDMLFKVDELIAYVSQFMTLKIGDLLFTGTPAGVGPVAIGQRLEGYLEEEKLFDFHIR